MATAHLNASGRISPGLFQSVELANLLDSMAAGGMDPGSLPDTVAFVPVVDSPSSGGTEIARCDDA